jgi:hypothetical protein
MKLLLLSLYMVKWKGSGHDLFHGSIMHSLGWTEDNYDKQCASLNKRQPHYNLTKGNEAVLAPFYISCLIITSKQFCNYVCFVCIL